jgi:hypothetical protein
MNNHLLPHPYNQSRPPSWLDHAFQPLFNVLSKQTHSTPQQPSTTPINLHCQDDLPPIRVICISDTHNATPVLPPGDILIHAGDLTAHGTRVELQAQLQWLASQPHAHKIVIAGNHDILLDEATDERFLTRKGDSVTERRELDWTGIHYLQDEAVALELPIPGLEEQVRTINIYGSPQTPEFGNWAFQYPAIRDVWTDRIPDNTDIVVVHGPPALYGDRDSETMSTTKAKGDGYLLREIRRVKPKMVVCGHIHGAFGLAVIKHDETQDATGNLEMKWDGYSLFGNLIIALRSKIFAAKETDRETLVVNAAIAPGIGESQPKSAIAINFY